MAASRRSRSLRGMLAGEPWLLIVSEVLSMAASAPSMAEPSSRVARKSSAKSSRAVSSSA